MEMTNFIWALHNCNFSHVRNKNFRGANECKAYSSIVSRISTMLYHAFFPLSMSLISILFWGSCSSQGLALIRPGR